jgi:hypothetical protein
MTSEEALALVVSILEDQQIPYMLVGALSSNAHGIARATKDADIVVATDSKGVLELARQLGKDFHLDPQMQFETITHSIRNVICYLPTNFEFELFRLSQDEHHQERFRRRERQWVQEIQREAWIQTAEDVVIQKLRWKRRKDLDDAQNVLAVCAKSLDWEYLRRWTSVHGTLELLNQLWAELPNLDALDDG